jgi:hypothetical protein
MIRRSLMALGVAASLAFTAASALAQGIGAGAMRALPGFDLSGNWAPAPHEENTGDPFVAEYQGAPINEAARAWGLAWSPSRLTVPEHQCQVHVASYIYGGPLNLRIWEEKDPKSQKLIAIRNYISTYEQERAIWMDGRPHPPAEAPHTWMGFSTGRWEGNALVVTTTHMKQGWLRRNGLPVSDQASLTEYFTRHGDVMTHTAIVTDPVYLTEPYLRTQVFRQTIPSGQNWLYPCESVVEIADQPRGLVQHFLPGENPFINEFSKRFGIPVEVTLGGAETMYPDIRKKLVKP